MRVARELDPDESLIDREELELGCRLHDIGKLGVADGILNKTDELEPHEREAVERHPSIGRPYYDRSWTTTSRWRWSVGTTSAGMARGTPMDWPAPPSRWRRG